ncbi:MAG: hypothetical protein IJE16_07195 [Ruminococcus sp.]|nr:hypothetical protein [Ruminococcus sp.]
MKKILSIALAIIMMLSIVVVPVYAEEQVNEKQYLYYDKFYNDWVTKNVIHDYDSFLEDRRYDEIYYYYENETDEEPAWALVKGIITTQMWERKYGTNVGERIIWIEGGDDYSTSGHFVYVTELDEFIPLKQSQMDRITEYCSDFVKVIEENEYGQLVGDINESGDLDIIDATCIQRYLAGHKESTDGYLLGYFMFVYSSSVDISDFDRDGETTIFDATAIQMKLAKIEDTATTE